MWAPILRREVVEGDELAGRALRVICSVHIPCGVFGKLCEKRVVRPRTLVMTMLTSIAVRARAAMRVSLVRSKFEAIGSMLL